MISKIVPYIITLCFLGAIAYMIASCRRKLKNTELNNNSISADTVRKADPQNNPYNDLRNLALNAETEEIEKIKVKNPREVYGIVMDWDVGDGIATLVAFKTGDASLYLSSGGGIIGGGQHENVKKSAILFNSLSQKFLSNTNETNTYSLPDKNCVKFYLLTGKGKFVAQENMENIENRSSAWLPLFEEGNKVIYELRMVSEN